MSTAIDYEKVKTGIIDFNLTHTEEPVSGGRGSGSVGGFLSEIHLEPEAGSHIRSARKWHIHYREVQQSN